MGLGASMTQATSTAMLLSIFDESERGKALGLQLSAVGAGAVGGPVVGGFVVDLFGWQGVFLLTTVLAVIAISSAQVVLSRSRTDGGISGGRFDLVGAVISTAVLVVFLLAITNGADLGWRSPPHRGRFRSRRRTRGLLHLLGAEKPEPDARRGPVSDTGCSTIGVAASMISFMGQLVGAVPDALLSSSRPRLFSRTRGPGPDARRIRHDRHGTAGRETVGPVRLDTVQRRRAAPLGGRTAHSVEGDGGLAPSGLSCWVQ